MDHVAIMKKSWRLLPKILTGEKKIESRWYKIRCEAWGKVKPGDKVYFKDSGEPVNLVCEVSKVLEFEKLTPQKVKDILWKYGGRDGIGSSDLSYFFQWAREKKYCVLVWLRNPRVIKSFAISKKGFGSARAWLSVADIQSLKIG